MSRSLFLLIVLAILSVLFILLYFSQLDILASLSPTDQPALFNHLVAEVLIAAGLMLILLAAKRPLLRAMAYLLFTVFILLYSLQFASLYLSNEYLSSIAIANFQHIGLIINQKIVLLFAVVLIGLLVVIYITERAFKPSASNHALGLAACCVLLAVILLNDDYWLSENTLVSRSEPQFAVLQSAPLTALFKSSQRAWYQRPVYRELSAEEVRQAENFGINYLQQRTFPLVKDWIYQEKLPFPVSKDFSPPADPLNIIIFFSEGISARTVQPYNNTYPGLTPAFAEFAQSAMRVDNYYNHTFATYRGLLGQLCSVFPLYGGGKVLKQTDYYCLGNLLTEENYSSYFLFSQQKKSTGLDELLQKAGIKNVLAQRDLSRLYLSGKAAKRPLALSDQQFFQAIIQHLTQLEQKQSEDSQPFFVGLYNIETHAFYEISDDGVKYPQQSSYILDAIYNYDNAFAKFWKYFKQSGLAENTIVILTSDHAHFQDTDYISLVKHQLDYQPYFVDRIPLLIYHPGLNLPTSFDAGFSSSLDFAPTVAQLMGFSNRPNSFLGKPIFERQTDEGIAYGESHIYLLSADGIKQQAEYYEDPVADSDINQMYKVINNIQALEVQGRIWQQSLVNKQ